MPYIIPNNLLTPTEKVIKFYQCAMISVEGPQIKGKINMEGLEIPYDSQYTSMMTLNASASNQPVLYGFLGNNVTFLMIKATYIPRDPNWAVESTQYIEYYFSDNPNQKRYMGKLLILTGNSEKRIPQIYLTNPSTTQKVYLEIFMANQTQDDISGTGALEEINLITGLYYNNLMSDSMSFLSPISIGSTELHITDNDENVVLAIPYENINTITRITDDDTHTLLIGTDSEEKIRLEFLSDFNMKQSHSRLSWVLENTRNRYLTRTLPTIDADPPVITWTTSGSTTGYTILPWDGTGYTTDAIIEIFLSGVTDARDGIISILDSELLIYNSGSIIPLTGITTEGFYSLYFTVSDIAGNENTQIKYAVTDDEAPGIRFYSYASGSTYTMSISGDTVSGTYINAGDIRTFTIDYVYDNVDSGLTVSDVDVTIWYQSSATTTATISGVTYIVSYELTDTAGNTFDTDKYMTTRS